MPWNDFENNRRKITTTEAVPAAHSVLTRKATRSSRGRKTITASNIGITNDSQRIIMWMVTRQIMLPASCVHLLRTAKVRKPRSVTLATYII